MANNETKAFFDEVVADGCIIGENSLGVVERDGDSPIVPRNLMVSFDGWDDCTTKGEGCATCEFGGCCNLTETVIATVTRIGGKEKMVFEMHRGYQIGDIWSRWTRCYNWE